MGRRAPSLLHSRPQLSTPRPLTGPLLGGVRLSRGDRRSHTQGGVELASGFEPGFRAAPFDATPTSDLGVPRVSADPALPRPAQCPRCPWWPPTARTCKPAPPPGPPRGPAPHGPARPPALPRGARMPSTDRESPGALSPKEEVGSSEITAEAKDRGRFGRQTFGREAARVMSAGLCVQSPWT